MPVALIIGQLIYDATHSFTYFDQQFVTFYLWRFYKTQVSQHYTYVQKTVYLYLI